MKEFKGTIGNWKVKHSESKPAFNVIGTKLGHKYKIAICPYLPKSDFDKKETESNAKLISKSPQLLQALNEVCEAFENGSLEGLNFHYYKLLVKEATE